MKGLERPLPGPLRCSVPHVTARPQGHWAAPGPRPLMAQTLSPGGLWKAEAGQIQTQTLHATALVLWEGRAREVFSLRPRSPRMIMSQTRHPDQTGPVRSPSRPASSLSCLAPTCPPHLISEGLGASEGNPGIQAGQGALRTTVASFVPRPGQQHQQHLHPVGREERLHL